MEFILKFDNEKEVEIPSIKVKDILVIDEIPSEVIDTINVYDLCKTPFFYAIDKVEMLSWLQPHSTDVAITKLSKTGWRKELSGIIEILGFRSSIYILDNEGVHDSTIENYLHRQGYSVAKEGSIIGYKVFEYEKGLENSYAECFNPNFTTEIFSILFVSSVGFDTVVYCDVEELVDVFYYGIKNDKSIFMALPFNSMDYINNYLDNKQEPATKVNDKFQIQLF